MKRLFAYSFLILGFLLCCSEIQAQQWTGTTNLTSPLLRYGRVDIGNGTINQERLLTLHAASKPILRFSRGANANWDYEIYATGGGQLRFRGGANASGDNLTDHMIIRGNGKVSIGTPNAPTSVGGINIDPFKLFVAGGILTDEVVVRVGWADYVFEKDYSLLPLSAVEKHINEKGYLHNTPSAEEIEETGIHVGTITVNQQEKIEEIFLHLIDAEKKVEALQKEVEKLTKLLQSADQ